MGPSDQARTQFFSAINHSRTRVLFSPELIATHLLRFGFFKCAYSRYTKFVSGQFQALTNQVLCHLLPWQARGDARPVEEGPDQVSLFPSLFL